MRNSIVILLLLATSITFAQRKGNSKISTELQQKVQTTPVGFLKSGKLLANKKVLNSKMFGGKQISSFEIIKQQTTKSYFLARRTKLKNGYLTNFIPLEKKGNQFFATPYMGSNKDLNCFSETCHSCTMGVSQTGSAFCECVSTGGSCEDYDHSESSEVRLSNLFK